MLRAVLTFASLGPTCNTPPVEYMGLRAFSGMNMMKQLNDRRADRHDRICSSREPQYAADLGPYHGRIARDSSTSSDSSNEAVSFIVYLVFLVF